ncbi:MAG: ATP-binding protein [Dehalococcoidia bacterium]
MWDGDRVRQVLRNLLSNAIKYSPAGGEIGVRIEVRSGNAVVSVRDRGLGIPLEEQPFVFDFGMRVRQHGARVEGLGLGLSVSQALVEAHGGVIGVQSMPGEGSTFTFTLPLGRAEDDRSAIEARDLREVRG